MKKKPVLKRRKMCLCEKGEKKVEGVNWMDTHQPKRRLQTRKKHISSNSQPVSQGEGVYDSSSTASSTMGLRLEIFSAVSSVTTCV